MRVRILAAEDGVQPGDVTLPRERIAAKKGWKVAARPMLLIAKVSRITSRSPRISVSTPMLMPVFAPIYMAVAASTPPSRKPVSAERSVSCGMSPR